LHRKKGKGGHEVFQKRPSACASRDGKKRRRKGGMHSPVTSESKDSEESW